MHFPQNVSKRVEFQLGPGSRNSCSSLSLSISPSLAFSLLDSNKTKGSVKGSGMEICIECVAYFRAERWNCFQLTHTLDMHALPWAVFTLSQPHTSSRLLTSSSLPSPPVSTSFRSKNFVCCLILCCEAKVQLNYEFQFYFRANNNNNKRAITTLASHVTKSINKQ